MISSDREAFNAMGTPSSTTLNFDDGDVELTPMADGRVRVEARIRSGSALPTAPTFDVSLPIDLIDRMARHNKSCRWFCDSLARHEDPKRVIGVLKRQMLSDFPADAFEVKRLLDFGCGNGASSFAMAALLPRTTIIGVELSQDRVALANDIAVFRGMKNVQFLVSPTGEELPAGLGQFDFVMLSAVYEHLLPRERQIVTGLLWNAMKPGAAMFINQTPHRWFPYEHHSTELWFVNYLPDRLAHAVARKFSRQGGINNSLDWNDHLRGGIRGSTEGEILHNIARAGGRGTILQPRERYRDRADYWLAGTDQNRHRALKRALAALFRLSDKHLGSVPSMNIDLVIGKDPVDTDSH